jgi:hypothetical protein
MLARTLLTLTLFVFSSVGMAAVRLETSAGSGGIVGAGVESRYFPGQGYQNVFAIYGEGMSDLCLISSEVAKSSGFSFEGLFQLIIMGQANPGFVSLTCGNMVNGFMTTSLTVTYNIK